MQTLELLASTAQQYSSSDDDKDGMGAPFWTKIVFIILAFFEAFICGMWPICSPTCRESPKILGIANSFAGGIFLGIAFMHIMPEEIEAWNTLPGNVGHPVFPVPEMLLFIGYTIILILDKVLFDASALFDEAAAGQAADPAAAKFEQDVRSSFSKNNAGNLLENDGDDIKAGTEEDMNSAMKSYLNPNERFATRMKASLSKERTASETGDDEAQEALFVDNANYNLGKSSRTTVKEAESEDEQDQYNKAHNIKKTKTKETTCCPNMTPYILLMALSVHSVFEGLATGLQTDETQLINIVIAILVHKGAAGCSLGIALVKTFPDDMKLCRNLIFIFSIATPIGVGLGMAVANAGDIYDIIFSSLAAGTFVYIGCSEVIVEEFSVPGNRWWKLLAYLCGALLIAMLWFLDKS